ncbi:class I SAM-dependent methyltransferase [Streptomyces sp. TM32]|uniref:class I SAM-dependent methyltransferase n=1 Tax=Streptomyces sp. TM32 TaxID=1652669 RepID=UPI0010119AAE|nr:class I SAM-dependent methyltransferase [Streptomyces sp. TM32]RXS87472.1 class I SAM-dependent methyltransferase [Streptomyces sp. TM32]
MDDLDAFVGLLAPEGQALLAELRDHDPADELAAATRLRRDHPAPLVSAALGQARLRQRAAAKFGADAQLMYFTPNGVEQSTRTTVAAHRAARFAALGVRTLADLCCGIGGDALALARAGVRVLAVDRDPLACAAARANAEVLGLAELIEVRCADVTEVDTAGYDAVFVDPARRSKAPTRGAGRSPSGRGGGRATGGRIFDPEAYSPPLSWAVEAARTAPCAALKIAPGVPHDALPEDAETEWISDGGDVKEAVVWFGSAAEGRGPVPGGRRATLLPAGESLLGAGLPEPAAAGPNAAPAGGASEDHAPVGPVGDWLYEPDGAVIRAHLVADVARQIDGRLIDPTIAYITADRLTATPYATAYALTDVLPFNVKKLKALLRERQVGVAVIKKRGSAVEPEELRRKLKLGGGRNSCTIFLTRVAGAPTMLLGHPATDPVTPGR